MVKSKRSVAALHRIMAQTSTWHKKEDGIIHIWLSSVKLGSRNDDSNKFSREVVHYVLLSRNVNMQRIALTFMLWEIFDLAHYDNHYSFYKMKASTKNDFSRKWLVVEICVLTGHFTSDGYTECCK